jgi:hypothetical protein
MPEPIFITDTNTEASQIVAAVTLILLERLSCTVAQRYYNCCTDGRTGPRNYG